jgi:DNA helicase-2/ATP-dependent DNA helicase PcrA
MAVAESAATASLVCTSRKQRGKTRWVPAPTRSHKASPKKILGWRIGESVAHAKFGEGVIVNIEGSGGSARAHINFGKHGMKLLDLSVAKLDKLVS